MDKACQRGREEIPLGTGPAGTDMPALRAAFLLDLATVTRLRESRAPGVDQDDRPASTHSQAGQPLDKHPRRAELDGRAVGPLPGPIRQLLQLEGVAQCEHL